MAAYENEDSKPTIKTTRDTFKIILPNNMNPRKPSIYNVHQSTDCVRETAAYGSRARILSHIQKNGSITRLEAENVLKTSPSTTSRIIRKMEEEGILIPHGKARSAEYTIATK